MTWRAVRSRASVFLSIASISDPDTTEAHESLLDWTWWSLLILISFYSIHKHYSIMLRVSQTKPSILHSFLARVARFLQLNRELWEQAFAGNGWSWSDTDHCRVAPPNLWERSLWACHRINKSPFNTSDPFLTLDPSCDLSPGPQKYSAFFARRDFDNILCA